ncbi:MAG: ABC transporter permease [Verrucomicrobiota bacterium]
MPKNSPKRTITVCLIIIAIIALASFAGPFLSPYQGSVMTETQFANPGTAHWFGTDINGFDVFTRTLEGARISILVGILGAGISLIIGTTYGMVSGLAGGKIDNIMMRFVDFMYSLPRIILVILLISVFDQKVKELFDEMSWQAIASYSRLFLLFVTLGLIEWLTLARIVRGQVLILKEQAYIMAARSQGAPFSRIIFRHLLPNLRGIIIVYATLAVPAVILEESFLSFLGLGVQAPNSSLGTLLSDGAKMINPVQIFWWLLLGPAVYLGTTLLALNFLGDALRDHFDPKSSR